MDATIMKYKNISSKEAGALIHEIMEATKKAGGFFICIWHNTSLIDNEEYAGWRIVFEEMLKRLRQ
jgi:hypothetical protein